MSAPLVEVLMSTFNGARFLPEQIASIQAQTHPAVRLVVRDDGSTDGTVGVLADLDVPMDQGQNLGVPRAFFQMLDASGEADFYSLADQDDVWEADKLARAVAALSGVDGPALYCARVMVTDEQLRPLYPHELPRRGPSFANALVQNIALGCTIVLNRAARDLVRERWPAECVMHDAWLYLVIAGCGTVVYDEQVVVQYRQHGGNTVGMGSGPVARLAGRVRRQLSPDGPRKHSGQDRELLRLFPEDLHQEAQTLLLSFLNAQGSLRWRASYAVSGAAHRQTRGSDLVWKALQVAGRV